MELNTMGLRIKQPRYRIGTSIGGVGLGISFGLGGCSTAGAQPIYTAPLGKWEYGPWGVQPAPVQGPPMARTLEQYLPAGSGDVLGWLWAHMPWDVVLSVLGAPYLPGRG